MWGWAKVKSEACVIKNVLTCVKEAMLCHITRVFTSELVDSKNRIELMTDKTSVTYVP